MLNLKRWFPSTVNVGGEVVTMELKRLNWSEAQPFLAGMGEVIAALNVEADARRVEGEDDKAAMRRAIRHTPGMLARAIKALDPAFVATAFRSYVRKVEGVTIDGEPATTGEQLHEVADQSLVLHVMTTLMGSATIRADEGKASPSASTSDSAGSQSGPSPAEPVAPEGGAAPETATPTPVEQPSSLVPA